MTRPRSPAHRGKGKATLRLWAHWGSRLRRLGCKQPCCCFISCVTQGRWPCSSETFMSISKTNRMTIKTSP